ncbi:MAG TPA: phospholipase C, phosphocholine-specific [Actinocrinis sp.]|uniref:phosphocholine-specific phospholipase C n=1 Tax=Actinocrinis sp. TaxID=1920516 RepID=UPI002D685068|nr:phospholipase C, phosphocholine-specific [Actinocrinis sp.]HZU58927.1 phospholipase C, phosphocholine-specific [Actinocrinis sp.]
MPDSRRPATDSSQPASPQPAPPLSRRRFLGTAAGTAAAAGALPLLAPAMAEALAEPAGRGSLDEIEHVVILMQENRSFDHYYGTMSGVRGFGDRAALQLPTGRDVFHQPAATRTDGGYLLPFHVDTRKVDGQDLGDLDHSWTGTHAAYDSGRYDQWIAAKSQMTMGYFTETDIPFHRALADAFTISDAYHCSIQGPTTPNRLYLWTGTIDPEGIAGGPIIYNPDDYLPVLSWTTYPERLQAAGISWRVYANNEVGDDPSGHPFVGDYGDNPLWLFRAYHDALASSDPKVRQLAERAGVFETWQPDSGQGKSTKHVLSDFIADIKAGTLPAVSWVVAPYGYCEHPAARPVDGAAYTQTMLEAIWSDPKLWRNTVVLITYDENDGFFDHVVPATAPTGTPGEFVGGLPIGLGPRVPLTLISPWSRGGWVDSAVADHTSVLRFLECWTGVREPNISAWRRVVCSDLTGAFDFGRRNLTLPVLPDTSMLRKLADQTQPGLPARTPPAPGAQSMPRQDPGTRPARALPYQPTANARLSAGGTRLTLGLANGGAGSVHLQVYQAEGSGVTMTGYDVAPRGNAGPIDLAVAGPYDVTVHGPNGFLTHFAGNTLTSGAGVEVTADVAQDGELRLTASNRTRADVELSVRDLLPREAGHGGAEKSTTVWLAAGEHETLRFDPLRTAHGWYDLSVTISADPAYVRRFAGHIENGKASVTG